MLLQIILFTLTTVFGQYFGFRYQPCQNSVEETANNLIGIIDGNPNINLGLVLDLRQLASESGELLAPGKLIFFGNPNLGTPLMEEQGMVALDLPMRMLVWEESSGDVFIAYNDPLDYLRGRYTLGVGDLDAILGTMSGALANFARTAAGNLDDSAVMAAGGDTLVEGEGILQVLSQYSAEVTASNIADTIVDVIESDVYATVNHASNAAGVGLVLPPTYTLLWANLRFWIPIMRDNYKIALHISRFGIWQFGDDVWVAYEDIHELADIFGLTDDVQDHVDDISRETHKLVESAATDGFSTECHSEVGRWKGMYENDTHVNDFSECCSACGSDSICDKFAFRSYDGLCRFYGEDSQPDDEARAWTRAPNSGFSPGGGGSPGGGSPGDGSHGGHGGDSPGGGSPGGGSPGGGSPGGQSDGPGGGSGPSGGSADFICGCCEDVANKCTPPARLEVNGTRCHGGVTSDLPVLFFDKKICDRFTQKCVQC